jgi:hypothetical protein
MLQLKRATPQGLLLKFHVSGDKLHGCCLIISPLLRLQPSTSRPCLDKRQQNQSTNTITSTCTLNHELLGYHPFSPTKRAIFAASGPDSGWQRWKAADWPFEEIYGNDICFAEGGAR